MTLKKILFFSTILLAFTIKLKAQETRAVIVGISEYGKIANYDETKFCKSNAELFYKALSNKPIAKNENMLIFRDEKATKFNILFALITQIEESAPNDNLFFYFSGYIDVSSSSDTNGYLLCYNSTDEGFYSGSDAIRISTLKNIVEIATNQGINVHLFFDIYSNNHLPGGYAGANKTIYFLKEKWNKTSKLISRDSLQFDVKNDNNGMNSFFTDQLEDIIKKQRNSVDFLKVNEEVMSNVARESNRDITPVFVYDDSINFDFNTLNITNSNNFKFFYSIHDSLLTPIQSFKNTIFGDDPNKIYSTVDKPELIIDSTAYTLTDVYGRSALASSANNVFYIGSKRGDITIFNYNNFPTISTILIKDVHDNWGIKTLTEYDQNIIISGAWGDNKVKFTNTFNNSVLPNYNGFIGELSGHDDDVNVVKLSPNKRTVVSGGADKNIIVWSIDSTLKVLKQVTIFEYPQDQISAIEFINNSKFISGDEKGNCKIIEIIRGKPVIVESYNFDAKIVEIKYYGNKIYAACDDGKIHVLSSLDHSKLEVINIDKPISDIEITNFIENDNIMFIGINRNFEIILKNLDNDTIFYPNLHTKYNIDQLVFMHGKKLLALNHDQASTLFSMRHTEPVSKNFSAYYFYRKLSNQKVLTTYNEKKIQFLLCSGMLNYVEEVIYSFIVGKFVYPSIEEIDKALFFIDFVAQYYSKYNFINQKLETQKLILQIYRNLWYGNTIDLQNSISMIDSLRTIAPYAVFPLNQLAQVHTELNNLTLAEQNIAQAAKSLPSWTETMARKGRIYQKQGMYNLAADEYRKIIAERPDLTKGYVYLSQLYFNTNNIDSAFKYIELAKKVDSKNEFILNQEAEINFKALDISNSRVILNSAKTLSPSYVVSIINEGRYFEETGDLIRAEKNYEKLFGSDSSIVEPYYLLGRLYLKYGNLEEAENILTKGYAKYFDNVEIIIALAELFEFKFFKIQAKYEWGHKALQLYNDAVKLDPFYFYTYKKKAHFFEQLLKLRKNKLIPKNVLFTNSDSLNSQLFLDSIIKNLTLAKKYSPQNLDLLIEFSHYYYENNQKDSLENIQKYISKLNNKYQKLYYSGRFYQVTNDDKKAKKYFEKLAKDNSLYGNVFKQIVKIDLKNNDFKSFMKNRDKYGIFKTAKEFDYIYKTILGITKGQMSFSAPYDNYYIYDIAKTNALFIRNQKPQYEYEPNWEYYRHLVVDGKWIIIKNQNQMGLMLFNGQILIPMNFDSVSHVSDNIFECKIGASSFTYEVNIISAKLSN